MHCKIKIDFWNRFRGVNDDNIRNLSCLKQDFYYYQQKKEQILSKNGFLNEIERQFFNDKFEFIEKNIDVFIKNLELHIKPKIYAILELEKYGLKWVDVEIRSGKVKERFLKHYKVYIETIEDILNKKYDKYK